MAAEVETMFSVREVPWHGLGTIVQDAPDSKEAIRLAELDWKVISNPIYDERGAMIPGYIANTRDKDGRVLGIVSNKYKIVQNEDAFEFTDSLIDGTVKYETAGSLRGGKQVWLLAKLPEKKILGDKFDPYICFSNTHDGSGAIRVCMTPIRVVCNNTLNLALSTAQRAWSTRHMGDMASKLAEAKMTLGLAEAYMESLDADAQVLANKKISDAEVEAIFDSIYPIDYAKDSQRKINNIIDMKTGFFNCLQMPDIAQFKGTAWGVVNAATDFADHMAPTRVTTNYRENNWGKIMVGHPFVDAVYKKVAA